jgi:hypothetical protein
MAHKSFKRAQNLDPISFDLPIGRSDETVEFKCEPEIDAGVVLSFIESKGSTEPGTEISDEDATVAIMDLFEAAIVDEQFEQFRSMLRAKKKGEGIPLSMLMDIASWLGEQYAARPTGPSSDSGQSATSNGSPSTGGVLHAVTTYSKPEQPVLTT